MNAGQISFGTSKYYVFEDGTVRNCDGKIIKPMKRKTGYEEVGLHSDGKVKYVLIHRLVAMAFCENPNGYDEINHKNGDKSDNRACNLEWSDRMVNLKHAYETGLRENDVSPKSVIAENIQTGERQFFKSIYDAAKKLGMSNGNICMVCKGQRPYSKGYRFSYAR